MRKEYTHMHFDDEQDENDEVGSDELLSDDNLRLPDSASMLVRIHALRAWLTRRLEETDGEQGKAALALQQLLQEPVQETRLHRRERQGQQQGQLGSAQQALVSAQHRLKAYEEAQALLEECITHTTSGERALVEYYLTLEELVQNSEQNASMGESERTIWLNALADVQHRVEHVGTPHEEE